MNRPFIAALAALGLLAAAPQDPADGVAPLGDDGKALNLDFETGDLKDWTATGTAFDGQPIKGEHLAEAQEIPLQFLEHILLELKHAGLVRARRGAKGGYWLARPADDITIADLVRAVEGPIAQSRTPFRSRTSPFASTRCMK